MLERDGRVLFRYCDEDGQVTDSANPNGSANNIAGIVNESGQRAGYDAAPGSAVVKNCWAARTARLSSSPLLIALV